MGTWTVLSKNQAGSLRNIKDELKKYKMGIVALQEIRQRGAGIMETGNFKLLYSGNKNNTIGTGFLANRNYKHSVIGFETVSKQIYVLRVRDRLFNISFICMYVQKERKKINFMKNWKGSMIKLSCYHSKV
jgi:hypothetical protein